MSAQISGPGPARSSVTSPREARPTGWIEWLHQIFVPISNPEDLPTTSSPEFERYSLMRSRQLAQLGLVAAIATMFVMALSDFMVFGDSTPTLLRMLAFRVGLTIFCLVMYRVIGRMEPGPLIIPTAVGTYFAICAAGFGFMGTLGGPEKPFIFTAFMMPIFPGLIRVPLRTRAWVTAGGVAIMLLAYFGPHPSYIYFRYNAFLFALLFCTAAGMCVAGDAFYRLERIAFERSLQMADHAARLAELNQLKDTFVANVSHELRTPLTAILGLTDVVLRRPDDPQVPFYLKTVKQAGESLLSIVDDILDLARMKADKLVIYARPTNVGTLVTQVVDVLRLEAERRELALTSAVPSDLPLLTLDGRRVKQILINLVANGLKFTAKGGVHISVELEQSSLVLRVEDTGPGIPPDKREAVFSEFVQLDPTATRRHGGTGLGLSIVRRLTGLMGGSVEIDSDAPSGTVFVVHLPVAAVSPQRAIVAPPRSTRPYPQLLVADDNPHTRTAVQAFALQTGVHVDLASDGEEALWLFAADEYDLVLLDIQMPAVDGYGTARGMRALESDKKRAPATIVALSAHAGADFAALAREAGFSWTLTKPFRLEDFEELLARFGLPGKPSERPLERAG